MLMSTMLVQLSLLLTNGIQDTLLSWITSCYGSLRSKERPDERNLLCNIHLRIYHSCYELKFEEYSVNESPNVFQSQLYNRSNPNTVLFAMSYLNDINDKDSQEVIRALCNRCQFNIIVLDNSCNLNTKNIISYPATMLQVYSDAQRYAAVVNRALDHGLVRGEDITGLGYSLGGQMMGHICRLLRSRCGSLYAFDPPGPFYLPQSSSLSEVLPPLRMVSRGDADLVVFVGCNEGVIGTPFRSGDVNIHVNGGKVQPGCHALSMTCNHRFCRKIMLAMIASPGTCQARFCESKTIFKTGLCNDEGIFILDMPLKTKYIFQEYKSFNGYMDTLETDSCQGYRGSVYYR